MVLKDLNIIFISLFLLFFVEQCLLKLFSNFMECIHVVEIIINTNVIKLYRKLFNFKYLAVIVN